MPLLSRGNVNESAPSTSKRFLTQQEETERREQTVLQQRFQNQTFRRLLNTPPPGNGKLPEGQLILKGDLTKRIDRSDDALSGAVQRLKELKQIPKYRAMFHRKKTLRAYENIDAILYTNGLDLADSKEDVLRFSRLIQTAGCDITEVVYPLQNNGELQLQFAEAISDQFGPIQLNSNQTGYIVQARRVSRSPLADIYQAVWKEGDFDNTGTLVAVKDINCASPGRNNSNSEVLKRRIGREAVLWSRMDQKNILPFIGVWSTTYSIYLVSKWAEHQTLVQYLKPETRRHVTGLLRGVIDALAYLHSGSIEDDGESLDSGSKMKIYHGDLHRANVFVDRLPNGEPVALLGDFGQAGDLHAERYAATFMSARHYHMAPELYKHYERCSDFTTPLESDVIIQRIPLMEKGDVYALGILAWEMYAGVNPFDHSDRQHGVKLATIASDTADMQLKHPDGMPHELFKMIQNWTKFDPSLRPKMSEVQEQFDAFERLDPAPHIDFDAIATWLAHRKLQRLSLSQLDC